jgi:drug/metabolite transporter (DMT)-like permease
MAQMDQNGWPSQSVNTGASCISNLGYPQHSRPGYIRSSMSLYMKTKTLQGTLLIAAAACCYGMLGTFVKLAYRDGFTTADITISQFTLGFVTLLVLHRIIPGKSKAEQKIGFKSPVQLMAAGSSLGLTSIFYYTAIQYIAVSLGIVLLLQAVWMSMVLEAILHKQRPTMMRLVAVFIIVTGTVLATGVLYELKSLNGFGIMWGLLAAMAYTATLYSSNHLQLHLPPLQKSFWMVTGGLVIILLVFSPALIKGISIQVFISWGLPVALSGTIFPPVLFARGMPLTGMGSGAILTSLEVPVSIVVAHYWLGENISLLQWLGVLLILAAVVLLNIRRKNAG